ncbi:NAD-dependent epimerase/dehydratase family protein [Arachidicoccus sp.]|uniref:NAD-dependent epimerase/dehydratase family protein n=1 Tax=Arachidicoccus sp. TaxID=1872624 RepID=UPI003D24911E
MHSLNKETILVTGASGLVGSHLLNVLSIKDSRIIAICRNIPQDADTRFDWISCDILDVTALREIMKGVDKIYHCAAIVSFNPKMRKELLQINIEGTANVVNAAIENGVKKMLYVSSVAAIGEAERDGKIIHEALEWKKENASAYGLSKHYAEMEVWRGISEGLKAVIINPSVILGCADWDKGSAEIFKTVYNEFPWYTEGVHGFVDVKDVAKAAVMLMDHDVSAERFILNGINISYKDLFFKMAAAFNKKPPHKEVTKFLSEVIWRVKYLQEKITGKPSILNKRTARTAMAKVEYSSGKLKEYFPHFEYTDIDKTISRISKELQIKYVLR